MRDVWGRGEWGVGGPTKDVGGRLDGDAVDGSIFHHTVIENIRGLSHSPHSNV